MIKSRFNKMGKKDSWPLLFFFSLSSSSSLFDRFLLDDERQTMQIADETVLWQTELKCVKINRGA